MKEKLNVKVPDDTESINIGIVNGNIVTEFVPKCQFKDGDIVVFENPSGWNAPKIIIIYKSENMCYINSYVALFPEAVKFDDCFNNNVYSIKRYATEEEKQQLFDALAKQGKKWNAETKQIEEIEEEYYFNPFDKVLIKSENRDIITALPTWEAYIFSHYEDNKIIFINGMCVDCQDVKIIPYEGNEHLLGTNKNI